MRTPEGKVKDDIKKWLKNRGVYFFMPVQTGMGTATLDIICCYRGVFVAIEVKSRIGQLTNRQSKIIDDIREAGGWAFIAYSVEDVENVFQRLSTAWTVAQSMLAQSGGIPC